MGKAKIAITLDEESVEQIDRMVDEHIFQSRSQAVQEAVSEKLRKVKQGRLASECAKLDRNFEKAMAEEGLSEDIDTWPEY